VVNWFGGRWSGVPLRRRTVPVGRVRIALAVLNESTYDVVAEEADRLAT